VTDGTDLFVYGTLMVPALFGRVSGELRTGVPARLAGFRRGRIRRQDFPGIVPEDGAVTEGMLYPALTSRQLARIDAFEDDFYARERVLVETIDDALVTRAFVYVVVPRHRALVTDDPWDVRTFIDHHLHRYLEGDG